MGYALTVAEGGDVMSDKVAELFEQVIHDTDAAYGQGTVWHTRFVVCTRCGTIVHRDYRGDHVMYFHKDVQRDIMRGE